MERDGTAPPPIDLDAMMNSMNEESDKPKDDTAANLLKDLQGDGK